MNIVCKNVMKYEKTLKKIYGNDVKLFDLDVDLKSLSGPIVAMGNEAQKVCKNIHHLSSQHPIKGVNVDVVNKIKQFFSTQPKKITLADIKDFPLRIAPQKLNAGKYFSPTLIKEETIVLHSQKIDNDYTKLIIFDERYSYTSQFTVLSKNVIEIVETSDKLKNIFKNIGKILYYGGQIGSDPEIFVENNEKIIPAFEFLGSKEKPEKWRQNNGGGAFDQTLYWDGFQAEFTTTPVTCLSWHVDSIQSALSVLSKKAKAYDKDAKLSIKTLIEVPMETLQNAAPEHVAFGCTPSFNAYGMQGNITDGKNTIFRSAGGHIHFGVGQMSHEKAIPIVKALDKILGVACVSLFAKYDNPARRMMYGLAGEYRLPKHGIEYRTLSNAWLCHPLITNIVFDVARKAFSFGQLNFSPWDATEEETISCINNCDVELAKTILKRNEEVFLSILNSLYGNNNKGIYEMFLNGLETVITSPDDIEKNWSLNATWIPHCNGVDKSVITTKVFLEKGKKAA